MYNDLILNASLLVALSTLYNLLARARREGNVWVKILSGLLFGGVAIAGMMMPFHYAPGVIYDGRSIVLAMAGLFGGGTAAAVSILAAGAYRVSLGGVGIWGGLATIISCALVGLAFRRAYGNRPDKLSLPMLYILGISAHVVMLACQLLIIPWPSGLAVIGKIWLPVLLIFPAATVLMGILLRYEDRRLQTTEEIKKSESLYRDLIETPQDLIWQCDVEGRYTYLNPAWEQVFGYKIEEMLGKKFADFQPPEYAEKDLKEFARLLKGNLVTGLETVHFGKDGREINLIFNAKFLVDEHGNAAGTSGTAYDITTHKRAEEALQDSELRFHSLFDTMNEGVALHSVVFNDNGEPVNYHIVDVNPQYEQIIGVQKADIVGKLATEAYGVADPPYGAEYFRVALQHEPYVFETYFPPMEKHFMISAAPWRTTGFATIFQDITERKRWEEALRKSEAELRAILNATPFPIALVDMQDNNIDYWSQSAHNLFGHTAPTSEEWYQMAYPDPEYRSEVVERWKPFLEAAEKSGQAVNAGEYQITCSDGSVRICELYAAFLLDRLVVTFNDITDRVQAEQELDQYRQHLEQLVSERTAQLEDFAYSVSHDLKAPLRGIHGYSRLLSKSYANQLDEEGRLFLQYINQAADNMRQLIDDLLEYSRMERREIIAREIDLQGLIAALLQEFDPQIKTGAVDIQVNLPCTNLLADFESLTQVLRNLLDNAIKYSSRKEDPKIEIGGRLYENHCLIWVRDNGIGFDMRYQERIFEIFQRLHRVDEYPGTGIGLAIVQKAMQRMGGQVRVESEPGQGTTFYLEFSRSSS